MDALHFLFYLAVGMGCELVVPKLPTIGPLVVSVGWHTYRADTHDVFEVKQETAVLQAGAALGRRGR